MSQPNLHLQDISEVLVIIVEIWALSPRVQSGSSRDCSTVLGRRRRQEPRREIHNTTRQRKGKVSRLHDYLHHDIASNVNVNSVVGKTDKHVRISK